ncbi:hypothetical protein DCAR_0209204 [Daucus carota subsp. sativus]|uniref:Uncharacterized protein n=1 Tax=Daucus carota subsp. sativus TaxID=79200 RepID=A0A166F3T8_DAUCS|nr:hypothetical protein DCAR_0209204 [Daucus carota subsp. sativus]
MSRRSSAYTKLEIEDPEDVKHRRAQFLIYKVLQQAAHSSPRRRRRSWLRIRMCKLRVRIGNRLKKLRKGIVLSVGAAKASGHKQVISHMRTWKRLFALV